MKREELEQLHADFVKRQSEVILTKNHDYADADALSNFKKAGAIAGLTPELQCLSLIAVKVARLGNLLHGKTPNNESIDDTVLDLANYSFLLHSIIKESVL
jgi:hypothetical protein